MSIRLLALYLALVGVGLAGGTFMGINIASQHSAAKSPEVSETVDQLGGRSSSDQRFAQTSNDGSTNTTNSSPTSKKQAVLDQLTSILGEGEISFALSDEDKNEQALKRAQFLSHLDPKKFLEYLTMAKSLPKKDEAHGATTMLLKQWAKRDPAAAWAYVATTMDTEECENAAKEIFAEWSKRTSKEALSQAKQLPAGALRRQVISGILSDVVRTNPEKAIEMAQGEFATDIDETEIASLYIEWAKKEPQVAAAKLLRLPANGVTENAIQSIVEGWSKLDPKAALQWVQGLPSGSQHDLAIDNVFRSWAWSEPEDASSYVLGLPNGKIQNQAIPEIACALSALNPDRFKMFMDKLPEGPTKNQAAERSVYMMVQRDPQTALQYVEQMPAGQMQTYVISHAFNEWAYCDVAGALECAQLLNGEMRKTAMNTVFSQWASVDPYATLDYLTKPENKDLSAEALAKVAGELALRNPQDAIAAADKIPESASRQSFLASVIYSWSENDPASAADYALRDLTGPAQAKALTDIAWNWAGNDPKAAATWISNLSDNDSKTNATRDLIWQWAPTDSKSAGNYLKQLPVGPVRDAGLGAYSDKVLDVDPAAATQWANSISDDKMRDQYIEMSYHKWAATAPDDARSWLANSSASDELKNRLQK